MIRKSAHIRNITNKSQKNCASSFCNCPQQTDIIGNFDDHCVCGENDSTTFDWKWNVENQIPEIVVYGGNVTFNPIYSQGTSVVRGNRSLDKEKIHYWEIKILSNMTGTDLMVGIGTDKVNLLSHRYKYSSFLGLNDQSWGYSYRGLVQHNERLKYYGKQYSLLCIVGVYLDLRKGNMEFYLNRRPQGIAYRQMKIDDDAEVYPMVCSTSAKSVVRLINATSFVETLQYLCMKIVSKDQKSIEFLKSTPGLRYLCKDYWFLLSKEQFQYSEFAENNVLLEDEALLCCLHDEDKYRPLDQDESTDESITDEIDIYNDVNDIKHRQINTSSCSSDDDVGMEFFCDHF